MQQILISDVSRPEWGPGVGSPDDKEWVRGTGATVTYDYGSYFLRIARDPYGNFSHNHNGSRSIRMAFLSLSDRESLSERLSTVGKDGQRCPLTGRTPVRL